MRESLSWRQRTISNSRCAAAIPSIIWTTSTLNFFWLSNCRTALRIQTERDRRKYILFRRFYRAAWSFRTILLIRIIRFIHTCPLIFEPVFLNPSSFHVYHGWYHHRCCTVLAVQVPETPENHPPSCLGSWSPPETQGAGGISPSPPGAPSGWRPVPAIPPVRGPVISGRCQDLLPGHQTLHSRHSRLRRLNRVSSRHLHWFSM